MSVPTIPTIEDAIIFAAQKHKGQKDKSGAAYIYHPLNVMRRVTTDEERIVAVLHDVVEDCGVTLDELRAMGYSENVVTALDFLTKRPEEELDYHAFIRRVARGPVIAIKVKLADLADNTDPGRRTKNSPQTSTRMAKYLRAIVFLEDVLRTRLAQTT